MLLAAYNGLKAPKCLNLMKGPTGSSPYGEELTVKC